MRGLKDHGKGFIFRFLLRNMGVMKEKQPDNFRMITLASG